MGVREEIEDLFSEISEKARNQGYTAVRRTEGYLEVYDGEKGLKYAKFSNSRKSSGFEVEVVLSAPTFPILRDGSRDLIQFRKYLNKLIKMVRSFDKKVGEEERNQGYKVASNSFDVTYRLRLKNCDDIGKVVDDFLKLT
jgi:hypothetical protein